MHTIKRARDDLDLLDLPMEKQKIPAGQSWRPPDLGWVKINTDGAIDASAQMGGGGGILRSHLSFLGARSKPLPGVTDPSSSRCWRVIFAQLRGFSHVAMEVDCLEVVNLKLLHHKTRSIVTPIFEEIREISSNFVSFSV